MVIQDALLIALQVQPVDVTPTDPDPPAIGKLCELELIEWAISVLEVL
jgi:hypothetical protein